ncbi:MAG: hypothetical protein SOT90_09110, partial [Muribaculaceae bacterium]|nr:hypothetical protein [Muribaculaceae bacterium]
MVQGAKLANFRPICNFIFHKRAKNEMLGDERGLAWCGGSSARGFKVRVLRWRSGGRALCCAVVLREQRVEQSEISEHSEHS